MSYRPRGGRLRAIARRLSHVKGLRQIVICAGVHALHPLDPAPTRGQDEDGGPKAAFPPPLEDDEPIEIRQAEIEDNGYKSSERPVAPSDLPVRSRSTTKPASRERAASAAILSSSSMRNPRVTRDPTTRPTRRRIDRHRENTTCRRERFRS